MAAHSSNFVTYNLHGLNNGKSGLFDLCSNSETALVAVQEHWLTPNNLKDLNSIRHGSDSSFKNPTHLRLFRFTFPLKSEK